MSVTIMIGDVREQLRKLADDSIHCCVTSPPYWGLRDYGVAGQIGLEPTPAEFIATMVEVFEEVRRVLRPDGTCWINMGDSYSGFKPKDLCMMPHRLAIALQDNGWWVRQDIVWSKPNPMPESVRDRCTKSHEYIFLLTKSDRYYYDADAIKEPVVGDPEASHNRWDTKDYNIPGQKPQKRVSRSAGNVNPPKGQAAFEAGDEKHRTKAGLLAYAQKQRGVGFGHGTDAAARGRGRVTKELTVPSGWATGTDRDSHGNVPNLYGMRNKRSVWTMATHSFKEAHFATFPPELPENCIKAGCPPGGIVLDPFFGAGTTGLVADRLQRDCIGIELNPIYAEMARKRVHNDAKLFSDVRLSA